MSHAQFCLASSPNPLTPHDVFAAGRCIRPRVLAQMDAGQKVLHLDLLMAYYEPHARQRCCGRTRGLDDFERVEGGSLEEGSARGGQDELVLGHPAPLLVGPPLRASVGHSDPVT